MCYFFVVNQKNRGSEGRKEKKKGRKEGKGDLAGVGGLAQHLWKVTARDFSAFGAAQGRRSEKKKEGKKRSPRCAHRLSGSSNRLPERGERKKRRKKAPAHIPPSIGRKGSPSARHRRARGKGKEDRKKKKKRRKKGREGGASYQYWLDRRRAQKRFTIFSCIQRVFLREGCMKEKEGEGKTC